MARGIFVRGMFGKGRIGAKEVGEWRRFAGKKREGFCRVLSGCRRDAPSFAILRHKNDENVSKNHKTPKE